VPTHGSTTRRSVEVEYWVIDDRGRLVEPDGLVEAASGVEREFVEPVLEVKTTPCATTAELRDELFDRLGRVLQRAAELDLGLVPLGTPVNADAIRDLPSDRTMVQDRILGTDFEYVRHCAGTHIHVEQEPGHEIDQLNTLVALDPALALVNSSPYFRGRHVADGARSQLYRRRAYDDLPHQGRLWRYVSSVDEWTRRLERRYETFVTRALDAGVDRRTVLSCFTPESAVWTPVQLRAEFGTVEWRSPDTALPSQIVRLADSVADVVDAVGDTEVRIEGHAGEASAEAVVLPEFETVLDHVDDAIRRGLDSDSLRSYLGRMGFDVDAFEPITCDIDGRDPIDSADARRLRLEYADRLDRDVRRARSISAD
jgi:gamma-glutamyl:cysteine ligase YbdK (ATP-grasp superfamily)